MKLSDFGTAHINGLRSSIQALEVQVTILKNLLAGDPADSDSPEQMEEAKGDEEDFAPKKKKAKKSAAFEEEETEETNSDDAPAEEEEEEIAPKKSKKKAPSFDEEEEQDEAPKKGKLTLDDVNDACLAAAKRLGDRKPVLALLKKEFQVTSVQNLEKSQYGELITALVKLKK